MRKSLTVILGFSAPVLLAQQIRSAQQDSTVVAASALKEVRIASFHQNDSLLNTAASIGVLTETELRRNNQSDISHVINNVPGVLMQSSNLATNRISIRGIGGRTAYGTNKIRAFYDGIALTSGDSETTIEDLDLNTLGQIEIIKGPFSSLYGAGLGGAILLTPAAAKPGNELLINSSYGSFALLKNTIAYRSNTEKSNFNLSYHHLQTDGWRENSSYKRDGVTLSGSLFKNKKGQLRYLGNYTTLKANIPSSVDLQTFEQNPRAAAITWADAKGYKQYILAMGGLTYTTAITEHLNNSTSVFISYKDNYEPRPFDILGQYTTAYGARTQFTANFKLAKIKSQYHFGLEYFRDSYAGRNLENLYKLNNPYGSLQGDLLSAVHQQRDFYNAFAQLRMSFSPKWDLQTGINCNKTRFELQQRWPDNDSESYQYRTIFSPQAALLFKPSNHQLFYISVSRGFSLPGISETLTPEGRINTQITPERGTNYEVGAKTYWFNKKLYTELSIYTMQIADLLVATRIGDDQYVGRNAGKTSHRGIEGLLRYVANFEQWRYEPFVSFSIGQYRFEQFIDRAINYAGKALTGVPATQAAAGLELSSHQGYFLYAETRFTARIPLNDANSNYSKKYWIGNAKTGWRFQLNKALTATTSLGINNLANVKYASLILPNASSFSNSAPRYYYPGLALNYYFEANFAYRF